jgi:predicted secreted protein
MFASVVALVASGTIVATGICLGFFCSSSLSNWEEKLPMEKGTIKIFSNKHHGQTLEIKPGESFMLILPNPGSGGYIVQDPEFDSQILTLQKMEKKPPSDPRKEGDFGSLEWTFNAKKEGISALIIRAFRPWEKDKAPIVIFEASIEVSQ